ncbi:hypothetical protein ACWX0P_27255 [Vibrio mediterranei]
MSKTQTIAGRKYQVIEGLVDIDAMADCRKCAFTFGHYPCVNVACVAGERDDRRDVYFVEVKDG